MEKRKPSTIHRYIAGFALLTLVGASVLTGMAPDGDENSAALIAVQLLSGIVLFTYFTAWLYRSSVERAKKSGEYYKHPKIQGPGLTAMAILSAVAWLIFWIAWITDKANYGVWIPGLILYIFLMALLYYLARKKQDGNEENK